MNILCFGQQGWEYCWQAQQHFLSRLALRGHRVLYIEPESLEDVRSARDALRSLAPGRTGFGLRQVGPRLHVFGFHHTPLLRWRLNERRRRGVIRAIARRLRLDDPVVLVLHPIARRDLGACAPRALVYYALDEASAFGGLPDGERRRLRAEEDALLAEVDLALAVSPRLLGRIQPVQPRSYLLENGADVEHFAPRALARVAPHPGVAALPHPRLGFVGQIDERLDQPLLLDLARGRPEWQLLLAGRVKRGVDVSALRAEPNIHLLGYQPYVALPSLLREMDVCLVPYVVNELTQSSNPLKIFEYLATGLPVVATPLDGIRSCRHVVALAAGPAAVRDAIERSLADPHHGRLERLAAAEANSWDFRVDELEARLEEAVGLAGEGGARLRLQSPPARVRLGAPTLGLEGAATADPPPSLAVRLTYQLLRSAGWIYYALRVTGRLLAGRRPVAIRRILVARRSRLGDLVVFLPALTALRQRYPHARIVLGVQPGMAAGEILEHSPVVDEVRPLDHFSRPTRRGQLRGLAELFLEGFDLVVSGASHFLLSEALLSGAPHRVGLDDGHPLQALNRRVLPLDPTRPEAENNLALIEALGGSAIGVERIPALLSPTASKNDVETLLAGLGIPEDARIVTVHPGAQKPSRRWPADNFAELIASVLGSRPDLWVVLSGVPEERDLVASIRARIPEHLAQRAPSSVGHTTLPSFLSLLDRSEALVCNDTGVMHLARARGTPLIALLGPENDRRWGPHPAGMGHAASLRVEVPCAPCTRWECGTHYCLRSLPVSVVLEELSKLIGHPGSNRTRAALPRPLIRWRKRRNWGDLADDGFPLPVVSVFLFTSAVLGPDRRRGDSSPAADGDLEAIRASLVSLDRQRYPAIEIILVEPTTGAIGAQIARDRHPGAIPLQLARPRSLASSRVWRAALDVARGDFIAGMVAGEEWGTGKINAEVAALVREPSAAGSAIREVGSPESPDSRGAGALPLFRRSVLMRHLEEPVSPAQDVAARGALALWPGLRRAAPVAPADDVIAFTH